MVRVKFIASAQRYAEEIVNGDVVVKDYLASKNAVMNAYFTANGTHIGDKLHMTFNELIDNGYIARGVLININETIKTDNAAC